MTEDSKEFQYVTRPEDNPPRQGDDAIALLLAIPLPLLFFGAICFGIKTHGCKRSYRDIDIWKAVQMLRKAFSLVESLTRFTGVYVKTRSLVDCISMITVDDDMAKLHSTT